MTEELKPIRPIFVYIKTPTTMDKLKVGDIFSIGKASPEDEFADESYIFVVEEGGDPKQQEGKPEGYFKCIASRLMKEPDFGEDT